MKTKQLLSVILGLAVSVTVVACDKKKEGKSEDKAGDAMEAMADRDAMGGMDGMEPAPAPEPPKGPGAALLKDPVTQTPEFKAAVAKLQEIGKACEADKANAYWIDSCKAFKAFYEEKKQALEDWSKSEAGKKLALTWILAGVDRLADEAVLNRATAIRLIGNVLYFYHHGGMKEAEPYRLALIDAFKASKDRSEKELVLGILASDGGTAEFRGAEGTAKFLHEVAGGDAEKELRQRALQIVAGCVAKSCAVPAAKVKAWYAAEKDEDCKDTLVRVAGQLKLADDVDTWCKDGIDKGTPSYGCVNAYQHLLDEARFDKTLAMVQALIQHDAAKQEDSNTLTPALQIIAYKAREPWAQAKVRKLFEDVFAAKETLEKRSPNLVSYLAGQIQFMAGFKKEDLQWGVKVLTREEARFNRAWKKDVKAKPGKAMALKVLLESRDALKKRLKEAK